MVIFLTSSFVKYQPMNEYVPKPLDESWKRGNDGKNKRIPSNDQRHRRRIRP